MARVLSKRVEALQRQVGRLSDGSDTSVVQEQRVTVRVLDDYGQVQQLVFGSDPSDAEILAALVATSDVVPVTKAQWETALTGRYETWQRWKLTAAEAAARGLPAAVQTALSTRTDAAWADYLAALQAWRIAS